MSFTISHAAAALPFYKSKLCLPAIIVGCMVPDFEYFIYFDYIRRGAHSIYGLFYFCIPIGLIILFLYYNVWRYIIADLCPDFIRNRLLTLNQDKYSFMPIKRFAIITISIIIGAILHDAWDMISHNFGRGTKLFPWLLDNVPYLHIQWWALFYALGTIVGMFMLMVALVVKLANTQPATNITPRVLPNKAATIAIIVIGIIFSIAFAWRVPKYQNYQVVRNLAFFVLGTINYSIIAISLTGIWHRLKSSDSDYLPDCG